MNTSKEEAIAILTLISRVGEIKGPMDAAEELLVRQMAQKMGVDEETTDKIITGELSAEISPPPAESQRIPYFQMCIMASGINGDFDEKEILYCRKLGLRLGLRDSTLDRAIALFQEYYPEPVPPEVLRKTFQISHN